MKPWSLALLIITFIVAACLPTARADEPLIDGSTPLSSIPVLGLFDPVFGGKYTHLAIAPNAYDSSGTCVLYGKGDGYDLDTGTDLGANGVILGARKEMVLWCAPLQGREPTVAEVTALFRGGVKFNLRYVDSGFLQFLLSFPDSLHR